MLAQAYRFHGHGSLKHVYAKGTAIRGNYGVLKYAPNSRRKKWRGAVVVSKKIHKSAVVRNRIRRRIYEIFRTNIKNIPPVDVVFIVHSEKIASVPHDQLLESLLVQLQKADLLDQQRDIIESKE
jgi:ribonuclease P protein component